ncbi:MAG: tRNA pseudouridine(13) synthase TruD [Candidatus Undinarchaeales archaeon]|jgi:tRNA pseudouridine13 synthase|nr:tRNA pseudouridine(13) synthase TruD [Candidatus Undinarchaeales archaeon]MDP7493074.1 tRNA pseudouridine(13) synthase TruD [Candidatus Undinarchaeales archaeon]
MPNSAIDPPELERRVGIRCYRSSVPGIGGSIKTQPEDFMVSEVSDIPADPEGPHVVFTLRKRRWDTMGALIRLGRELGVAMQAFGFAGNKDRQAVTEQKVSLMGVEPDKLLALSIPGIKVVDVYRTRRKIKLGMLRGNRFTIVLRDIPEPEGLGERLDTIEEQLGGVAPNYLGIQRFGASRPNNHLVGKALVKGDLEGALAEFLWADHPNEAPRSREARAELAKDRDFEGALERFPYGLTYERAMLRELSRGRPPAAAFRVIPKKLLRLLIHAYQGLLFNRILSLRIEQGMPLDEPVKGDILLIGWKTIPVDDENIDRLTRICHAGKASVSLPLPGSKTTLATGEPGELERKVIEEEGTDLSLFSSCISSSEGTRRAAIVRYEDLSSELDPDERTVTLKFFLTKGAYATNVVREFIKGPVW